MVGRAFRAAWSAARPGIPREMCGLWTVMSHHALGVHSALGVVRETPAPGVRWGVCLVRVGRRPDTKRGGAAGITTHRCIKDNQKPPPPANANPFPQGRRSSSNNAKSAAAIEWGAALHSWGV